MRIHQTCEVLKTSQVFECQKLRENDMVKLRKEGTDKLIRRHVYFAMGVGLIPIPLVDFSGVAAIQLLLIRKLAQIYNVPFTTDIIKNMIGAMIGGAVPASAEQLLSSLLKALPLAGQGIGALSASILSGASTYAVGRIFERHFIEGETFLLLDNDKAKKFYEEMFKEGMSVSAEIKAQKDNGV
jgi:uncharacterized protein (DUF697 family)